MTTELNPSEATSLALNTLTSQICAIIQMPDGPAKAAIGSFETLLTANLTMISEAANAHIDQFNALIDELEARDAELDAASKERDEFKLLCSRMQAARREDEAKVRKIEVTSAQIAHQRDAYKKDAQKMAAAQNELKKATARIKRMEEAGAKRDAEHNEIKMKLQRTESLLMRATKAVVSAKDAITNTQHRMMLEGLLVEKIIEVKGVYYYLYRRPCVVAETFKPTDEVMVSRDHMYVYRVETSAGYHWDAIPTQHGTIGIVKHRAMPKEVRQYLADRYSESALFDTGEATLKTMELTKDMDSLAMALAELDAIDHSLTPLKVKDSLKQTRARKLMRTTARQAA